MHMPPMTCCLFDLFFDSPCHSPGSCHCHCPSPFHAHTTAYIPSLSPLLPTHIRTTMYYSVCVCACEVLFFAFTFFGGRKMFKNKTKMRPHYVRHPHNPTHTSTAHCPLPSDHPPSVPPTGKDMDSEQDLNQNHNNTAGTSDRKFIEIFNAKIKNGVAAPILTLVLV